MSVGDAYVTAAYGSAALKPRVIEAAANINTRSNKAGRMTLNGTGIK
jgi:hypothetical protein